MRTFPPGRTPDIRQAGTRCRSAAFLLLITAGAFAQDFSTVPGVVVNYEPAPAFFTAFGQRVFTQPQVYLGTPSITVADNGDYYISHDYFGAGTNEDTVEVFRSTDRGQTWTRTATIRPAFWSTIFAHRGALYLWGYYEGGDNGDIVIRRSTDHGVTWTEPTDADHGLLRDGNFGGTANAPVIHAGRLWIAQGGKRVMSAPVDADLLHARSWTLSNAVNTRDTPLGLGLTITEGQVVASPQTGVVVLPKIGGLANTVLLCVDPDDPARLQQPADADYVQLPGGEKKFGAVYDPVSRRFYVLSNPVLPAEADAPEPREPPEMIRNNAALLSSPDLTHWRVERVFLHTDDIAREGFQYLSFAIDGDDLVIASRTARVIPGERPPPRAHDSNLITFHRLENFRDAPP